MTRKLRTHALLRPGNRCQYGHDVARAAADWPRLDCRVCMYWLGLYVPLWALKAHQEWHRARATG